MTGRVYFAALLSFAFSNERVAVCLSSSESLLSFSLFLSVAPHQHCFPSSFSLSTSFSQTTSFFRVTQRRQPASLITVYLHSTRATKLEFFINQAERKNTQIFFLFLTLPSNQRGAKIQAFYEFDRDEARARAGRKGAE